MTPPSLKNPSTVPFQSFDNQTYQAKSKIVSFAFFIEEQKNFSRSFTERVEFCKSNEPPEKILKIAYEHFQLENQTDQDLMRHLLVNDPSWYFCTLTVDGKKKFHIRINNNIREESFIILPCPDSVDALFFKSHSFQDLLLRKDSSAEKVLKKI